MAEVSCQWRFLLGKGFWVFIMLSYFRILSKMFTVVIWRKEKREGNYIYGAVFLNQTGS